MASKNECTFYRWDSMKKERVSDMLERRLITGERMMLAHVYLKKGCIVPKHSHENEQLTYILEGALKFSLGEDGSEEITVRAGEVLLIPSNVPHKAEALEETLDVDVFSPPRQDWLDKKDDYLRRSRVVLGIRGKVALVAASSKGLGRAVAEELAAEGAHLVMCARGKETLEQEAESIRRTTGVKVVAVAADVSNSADSARVAKAAFDELGKVDILVTNSGGPPSGQ